MRGLGGEVFAHLPGRRGLKGRGKRGPKRPDSDPEKPKIDPKATQNSPVLTQIGPGLARKSPGWLMVGSGERGEGFFGEREGGVVGSDSFGRREIFGLLNFCCTRQACFI